MIGKIVAGHCFYWMKRGDRRSMRGGGDFQTLAGDRRRNSRRALSPLHGRAAGRAQGGGEGREETLAPGERPTFRRPSFTVLIPNKV